MPAESFPTSNKSGYSNRR